MTYLYRNVEYLLMLDALHLKYWAFILFLLILSMSYKQLICYKLNLFIPITQRVWGLSQAV